ncbi:hypothetical protein, partial [Ferrigenium sp. UT5]|uniref:hypothetical protein n=1 Tax=Ferrigenium sp. UT5 TaxID=3242105 RepID=UPI0038B25B76
PWCFSFGVVVRITLKDFYLQTRSPGRVRNLQKQCCTNPVSSAAVSCASTLRGVMLARRSKRFFDNGLQLWHGGFLEGDSKSGAHYNVAINYQTAAA